MNENIDLIKILKNCPKGFELYSPLFGNVKLNSISGCYIEIIDNIGAGAYFNKLGQYVSTYEVLNECLLFPSKEQRDWNKFTAPWYNKTEEFNPWCKKDKKKRFNPKTLHTYDKFEGNNVYVYNGGDIEADYVLTCYFSEGATTKISMNDVSSASGDISKDVIPLHRVAALCKRIHDIGVVSDHKCACCFTSCI